MVEQIYVASKTRSNRPGWSVTFKHPARTDARQQRGLKVRRGLGTSDDGEADLLVAQLNQMLSDPSWWHGDRRQDAELVFAPIVVSAFFDGIEIGTIDSKAKRDSIIPIPGREDGYSKILFLGTTGAGKTTLLRQVIGSDPAIDRFPSTSTARTTTADIEIITAEGGFNAAVTFMPDYEVRAHIDECLEDACLESVQERSDAKVMSALLQHREQRFRLSYILGAWSEDSDVVEGDYEFEDQASGDPELSADEVVGSEERSKNTRQLREYLTRIKEVSADAEKRVSSSFGRLTEQKTSDDRAAWLEIFGNEALAHQQFSDLALDIMEDVAERFKLVKVGNIETGSGEWPTLWTFQSSDRAEFLAAVRWFSSNHTQQFGRLLTPLVEGIRVRGPLFPLSETGLPQDNKLVLFDGQGLGHTANTTSSISTRVTQRFSGVDMILLVDNAQQPMQAAPLALMRAIGSSGFADKLTIAFTHFDQVKGANIGSFEQKREHVLSSVGSTIANLRDIVGSGVAGALDRQIDGHSIFLGGLDRQTEKLPTGFKRELGKLIEAMRDASLEKEPIDCAPKYEFKGLEIAMHDAIDAFQDPWKARLGLTYHDAIAKEHWTRVKALSRRLASGRQDEYDNLRPVADLLSRLQEEASKWLERPAGWTRTPKNEAEREAALDRIRRAVFARLSEITTERLKVTQMAKWRVAYDHSGTGSATRRARVIDEINSQAAPQMSAAMTSSAREFLASLYAILKEAIEIAGGVVLPIGG